MIISTEAARAYLERGGDELLMPLGALLYDPIQEQFGIEQDGALVAVALVANLAANLPDDRPTIMVTADDAAALERLVNEHAWPAAAVWSCPRPALLGALERLHGRSKSLRRGVRYYVTDRAVSEPALPVRQITSADADALDLAPCALSPTALRNWIRRGWRVFGIVQDDALLCHALAAYPVTNTEEISAVFTAPRWRRRGLARSVVAATAADIIGRGRRAVYVTTRSNRASQGVAEGLGFATLCETWEVVTGDEPQFTRR